MSMSGQPVTLYCGILCVLCVLVSEWHGGIISIDRYVYTLS